MKNSRGFTLIEVMVVVAIIGMIAAMGLPAVLSAFKKEGMRKACSDFEDVCFNARSQAIFSEQIVAVVIHPKDGTFAVDGASPAPAAPAGSPANPQMAAYGVKASKLPEGCIFSMVDVYHQEFRDADWVRIHFFPNGTCDDEVVVVIESKTEQRKISLDYTTGIPVESAVNQ